MLYGGTAIALRRGHRSSIDYDFFTDQPLNRNALYAAFPFLQQSTLLQDAPDALTALVPPSSTTNQHVKVSFFGTLLFGRVGEPELTDDGIVQVAALDDLLATKLKVVLQRIEAKDYRDIAAMIRAGQPSESLKALAYFEGGDLHHLTHEERALLIDAASSVRALPTAEIRGHALALSDVP